MRRKKGLDKLQKETWSQNHQKIRKLIQAHPGIRRLQIHDKTSLSRRVINHHITAFGENVKEDENRKLYWITDYELQKRMDERFKFLYEVDLQRRQQPPGRYQSIDVGKESFVYDNLTGERIFTIHNMPIRDTGKKILIRVPKTDDEQEKR